MKLSFALAALPFAAAFGAHDDDSEHHFIQPKPSGVYSEGAYEPIYIKTGGVVPFFTAWGFHNVFIAKESASASALFDTCDVEAMESSDEWTLGAGCSCEGMPPFIGCNLFPGQSCFAQYQDPPFIGPGVVSGFDEEGTYYAVCTAREGEGATHCDYGMAMPIIVSDDGPEEAVFAPSADEEWAGQWAFFAYDDMTVKQGDQIGFKFYGDYHNLAISTEPSDVPCFQSQGPGTQMDIPYTILAGPKMSGEWSGPKVVDYTLDTTDLAPGTYEVNCEIDEAQHCGLGMRFSLTIV
jgi:plastocyanin